MITVCYWHPEAASKMLPYTHNQIIEGSLDKALEVVKELYNKGLNVMLKHQEHGILIYVDVRGFSQR